ncbi:MAG TPA: hypothetical protein VHF50_08020 [Solirubrobacterales bacterium]|nr:hypothetical protein [Solirubrobacterales bacterium]
MEVAVVSNPAALIAAVAASVAVYAHGIVGQRWLTAQLRAVEMRPTPLSTRLFGEGDVSWRVFGVTWHVVTTVFAASALALYLTAFGALESRDLLRFIALVHAAFLGVGFVYIDKRPAAMLQPIPLVFVTVITAAAAFSWMSSGSV